MPVALLIFVGLVFFAALVVVALALMSGGPRPPRNSPAPDPDFMPGLGTDLLNPPAAAEPSALPSSIRPSITDTTRTTITLRLHLTSAPTPAVSTAAVATTATNARPQIQNPRPQTSAMSSSSPQYFKAWIIFFVVAVIGGMILGAIVGGILGGIMGVAGSSMRAIQIASGLAGFLVGVPLSYFTFRWSVSQFIVKELTATPPVTPSDPSLKP